MLIFEIIKVIALGIVEGVTEWLPISSTGHLILLDELIRLRVSEDFMSVFTVVIQLGAILAVAVMFFERLNPFSSRKGREEKAATLNLWGKVLVGSAPAAVLGLLLDDLIDRYLFSYIVVAITLIVYGIAFIFVEKIKADKIKDKKSLDSISYADAIKIGMLQSLSLIPGTSRSGSTILGGMLIGVSRQAAAEFSFFMAIPIMLGASALKIFKFAFSGFTATTEEILLLLVGIAVSFFVSLLVIRFLMDYVRSHGFEIFGYYRIILGIAVLVYFFLKQ